MIAGIVAAKKESSRLPNKNVRIFCGHPLFAWSVVQSLNSVFVDETYVSTDSTMIADIARVYGAKVIWRDYEEAPDAPANVPYCHAIRKLQKETQLSEIVTFLPTSPTRLPDDTDNMIRLKRKHGFREISSMTPHNEATESEIIGEFLCKYVLWNKTGRYVTGGGGMAVYDADHYLETADFDGDIWTWEQIVEMHKKSHIAGKFVLREMPYYPLKIWQQFDIDYQDDFELLEIFMERYILKGEGVEIYERYKQTQSEIENAKVEDLVPDIESP